MLTNNTYISLNFFWSIVLSLCSYAVIGQKLEKDVFRKKIDSLNRIASDYPVEVIKACDSFMLLAKKNRLRTDYAILLQVKGIALTSLGNNDLALKNHMRSYHIFDSIKDNNGKVFGLINIASVHLNLGNYGKAKEYLYKALILTDKKNESKLKSIYVNLGAAYQDTPVKAISYYRRSIPYLEKLHDYNGLAINYYNIGESYKELKDYKNSEFYLLQALHFQKLSGSKSTLAMVSLALGYLYTHNGEYKKALSFINTGGRVARELNSPYYKEIYYEYIAGWQGATANYKEQAYWLEQLLSIKDSINSDERVEANSAMEAKFQTNLKNKEIELLKAQKKLDESIIQKNRISWVIFFITSILSIIIIVILYRNYKLNQKANLLLDRQMSELEEQNIKLENENILVQFETLKNQVSPHFLFNSLNAIASLIKTNPDKALEFTGVFAKIFRNTLKLKDRHLITIDEEMQHVNDYLYLQKIRFGDSLIIVTSLSGDIFKQYLPPFSLQMVIENAIKHNVISEVEPLTITITNTVNALTISNNLQLRKHVDHSTGIGITNIISRYRYLNTAEPIFGINNNAYVVQLPIINEE